MQLPYERRILESTPTREQMLARWHPGAECAPHDHGAASGFVLVVRGTFEELCWEWQRAALVCVGTTKRSRGDVIEIVPGAIHSMRALDAGETLHTYRPSISRMRVYDLANARTYVVTGESGAWVPPDRAHIVATHPWASIELPTPPPR